MNRIAVIGSGFSGLSAACFLAKAGFDVTILEKNDSAGGRARQFSQDGFTFDMGPSWYWMPDVFEKFFGAFGKRPSDFYTLVRLDPSYRIVYKKGDSMDVPAGVDALCAAFEKIEPGSGKHLIQFLNEGEIKYNIGVNELVYKPGLKWSEFLDLKLVVNAFKLHIVESISTYIRRFFKNPRLIELLEFPVLFLGAKPQNTPALYSLMNYADMALGTWYPQGGGMYKIIEGMVSVAKELGVKFEFNSSVSRIDVELGKAKGVEVNGTFRPFDYIVASADYHHVEQELLPAASRKYSASYWQGRVMAPSSLIFYLGVNKKVTGLLHHTLFFDQEFSKHSAEIYDRPQWPTSPQFYVSCPSKTDSTVAPEGCENLFILVPVAPGLSDDNQTRERYFEMIMSRIEKLIGEDLRPNIIFKRSYAHKDFVGDYNSFKGNAYGLANTLFQTANLKPSIINKKVSNLFYTGQLTVPGPGVPPSLISGQVVSTELIKKHGNTVR